MKGKHDNWRHHFQHDMPSVGDSKIRLQEMFPTVAGVLEKVHVCWRGVLWRGLMMK
jgi:hypothetical protein